MENLVKPNDEVTQVFNFFKKKLPQYALQKKGRAASHEKSQIRIKYNPNLIDTLELEHHAILELYEIIFQALESQEFSSIQQGIKAFGGALKAHLLREHVELYIYLEYVLAQNSQAFRNMHALRIEMDEISSYVMGFLHTYEKEALNVVTIIRFKEEFVNIGDILKQRIKREEENLYTLYQPISP